MSEIKNITLNTGKVIPLRPMAAKSGNTFYATLARKSNGERYYTKYGVNVTSDVVGKTLPKTFTFDGKTFTVVAAKNDRGNNKVTWNGEVTVDNEKKSLSFRITDLGEGMFNVNASLTGLRGRGRSALDEL
jgi:hypothetical protein